ncbi:MAG: dihydropteroate synthase [Candidatus Omnitrophica bacterium CG08_land_8_20_14_0_20_41_16]|uniref:Dihydropteroate synthase n=1 Tax=Candidatus Sherwoodlollariibacterium unditelluris TaxID=1974757 RepID=A0A2G9YKR3_9BACT|nr:MAG: dihydropteroate synthase [Candidatus Omnitrophica bacterium CG23_combo_of_CG06-09_8_20_14_all_41_10]PIS33566.1 MAG: dihydropteroate synthase [Candidatus Omnitrophica bacterium CG08_land_8_20_14_0_20_41_16]
MRILSVSNRGALKKLMQDINVDPYGVKIMLPKAQSYLLKINSLSNISANILKQEMLSLGGDAALSADALTGRVKKTGCLVMGNLSQFTRLRYKLNKQPFGLSKLAQDLNLTLKNYQKASFQLKAGRYRLNLGNRSYIMGIVNVTPDSFSGDGLYKLTNLRTCELTNYIVDYAEGMVRDGADIIDVGGESSRPGAKPVSLKDEISRVIPVIKSLAKKINIPISVDTCKPEVARASLDNGASLVNDISGLRDIKMAKIVSRYKAGVVIMHMLGCPRSMQKTPKYNSLVDDIIAYLESAVRKAEELGVSRESIIIDPGIGFGKTLEHNLEILKRLEEFKSLGKPILIGASRKSFIGKILHAEPDNRLFGTVASCVTACANGANIVRVHDVKAVKEALKVADSIKR